MNKIPSLLCYVGSLISIFFGFYKLFVYENNGNSPFLENKNAYVGGDAYNLIINAGQATAYFTLSGVLILAGTSFLLWQYIAHKASKNNMKPSSAKLIAVDSTTNTST